MYNSPGFIVDPILLFHLYSLEGFTWAHGLITIYKIMTFSLENTTLFFY